MSTTPAQASYSGVLDQHVLDCVLCVYICVCVLFFSYTFVFCFYFSVVFCFVLGALFLYWFFVF